MGKRFDISVDVGFIIFGLFILSILIWILLSSFNTKVGDDIELEQPGKWYPSEDGVHEYRHTLFLSRGGKWVKEFEHRNRKNKNAEDNV